MELQSSTKLSFNTIEEIKHFIRRPSQPARDFSQTWSRFSPGHEGTEKIFYFFYKTIHDFQTF